MIDYTQISSASYLSLRYKFVKYFEESNSYSVLPYFDTASPPRATIGLGFNIESGPLDAVMSQFGIAPSETALRQQIRQAIANATNNTNLRSALNAIMANRAASLGGRSTFSFQNEAEVVAVFNAIAPTYENALTSDLPNLPLNTRERAILFSLAYNNPGALIGPGMERAIQNGDRAELFYEIRYNSNGGSGNKGIAKRRFMESEILGLFPDGPVSNEDALLAFRMFTKHEKKISKYDTIGRVHGRWLTVSCRLSSNLRAKASGELQQSILNWLRPKRNWSASTGAVGNLITFGLRRTSKGEPMKSPQGV